MHTARNYPLGTLVIFLGLLYLFALPGLAHADQVPDPNSTLALPSEQFYALLIGSLTPLAGYVVNHWAPWCDEKLKAVFQVLLAAVAGGLYQALDTGDLGLNTETLQILLTSIIAALFAHRLLWAPSTIAAKLGAGSNVQHNPAR